MNKITPINYERALEIAEKAHAGQVDKAGEAYIEHCWRVSESVIEDYVSDASEEDLQIVALLHDVLEDSNITTQELFDAGVSHEQMEALCLLTHKPEEDYQEYIKRLSKNEIANIVKLADLQDNLDLTRLESISEKDIKRINKYLKAYHFLDRG